MDRAIESVDTGVAASLPPKVIQAREFLSDVQSDMAKYAELNAQPGSHAGTPFRTGGFLWFGGQETTLGEFASKVQRAQNILGAAKINRAVELEGRRRGQLPPPTFPSPAAAPALK